MTLYTLYMATNRHNGKRYIGVTSKGMEKRKSVHLYRALSGNRGCPRFYDAIRKYGADKFDWMIIDQVGDKKAAFILEHQLVENINPEYNAVPGGFMGPLEAWNKIRVICMEDGLVFESMTAAGNWYGVGGGDICWVCRGARNTAAGGRHFAIYTGRLSKLQRNAFIKRVDLNAATRRRRSNKPPLQPTNMIVEGRDRLGRSAAGPMSVSRPVMCLDDKKLYPSVAAAAAYYKVCRSSIVELCLGKMTRKTVSGLRFSYLEKRVA